MGKEKYIIKVRGDTRIVCKSEGKMKMKASTDRNKPERDSFLQSLR